jgi:hypothetical protein
VSPGSWPFESRILRGHLDCTRGEVAGERLCRMCDIPIGGVRTRLFVVANTAFATAGAISGLLASRSTRDARCSARWLTAAQ